MKREHKTTEEILQELKGRSKNGLLRTYIDRCEPADSTGTDVPRKKKEPSDIEDLVSSILDD